jgi:hypothetical protein
LDRIDRDVDQTGFMEGLLGFEDQACRLLLGKAPEAFELKNEDPKIVEAYGKGLGTKSRDHDRRNALDTIQSATAD